MAPGDADSYTVGIQVCAGDCSNILLSYTVDSAASSEQIAESISELERAVAEGDLMSAGLLLAAISETSLSTAQLEEVIALEDLYIAAEIASAEEKGEPLAGNVVDVVAAISLGFCGQGDGGDRLELVTAASYGGYSYSLVSDSLSCVAKEKLSDGSAEGGIESINRIVDNMQLDYSTQMDLCGEIDLLLSEGGSVEVGFSTTTLNRLAESEVVVSVLLETGSPVMFVLPKGLDEPIRASLRQQMGDAYSDSDHVCVFCRRQNVESSEACDASSGMASNMAGLALVASVRSDIYGEVSTHLLEFDNLEMPLLIAYQEVADEADMKRMKVEKSPRFALTTDGDDDENYSCAIYVPARDRDGSENCIFDTISCVQRKGEGEEDTDEGTITCLCYHLSDFSVLFGGGSNEGWTIYRIISLSLLGATWMIMILFMVLITFSRNAQICLNAETTMVKDARVLGNESDHEMGKSRMSKRLTRMFKNSS